MHLTDSKIPQHYKLSSFVPDAFLNQKQSGTPYDAPYHFAVGKGSSAFSSDAASVQKRMIELAIKLLSCQAYRRLDDSPMVRDLFPMHVDLAEFEKTVEEEPYFNDRQRVQIENRLRASFEAEPLEDGMDHPAEQIVRNMLDNKENLNVLDLFSAISLDIAYPSFAASVLRCLGRQPRLGTVLWRTELVRDALRTSDIEIRDAAVQAAELWGDYEIRNVLEQHSEPEPWLRDYINDVIVDMSE